MSKHKPVALGFFLLLFFTPIQQINGPYAYITKGKEGNSKRSERIKEIIAKGEALLTDVKKDSNEHKKLVKEINGLIKFLKKNPKLDRFISTGTYRTKKSSQVLKDLLNKLQKKEQRFPGTSSVKRSQKKEDEDRVRSPAQKSGPKTSFFGTSTRTAQQTKNHKDYLRPSQKSPSQQQKQESKEGKEAQIAVNKARGGLGISPQDTQQIQTANNKRSNKPVAKARFFGGSSNRENKQTKTHANYLRPKPPSKKQTAVVKAKKQQGPLGISVEDARKAFGGKEEKKTIKSQLASWLGGSSSQKEAKKQTKTHVNYLDPKSSSGGEPGQVVIAQTKKGSLGFGKEDGDRVRKTNQITAAQKRLEKNLEALLEEQKQLNALFGEPPADFKLDDLKKKMSSYEKKLKEYEKEWEKITKDIGKLGDIPQLSERHTELSEKLVTAKLDVLHAMIEAEESETGEGDGESIILANRHDDPEISNILCQQNRQIQLLQDQIEQLKKEIAGSEDVVRKIVREELAKQNPANPLDTKPPMSSDEKLMMMMAMMMMSSQQRPPPSGVPIIIHTGGGPPSPEEPRGPYHNPIFSPLPPYEPEPKYPRVPADLAGEITLPEADSPSCQSKTEVHTRCWPERKALRNRAQAGRQGRESRKYFQF